MQARLKSTANITAKAEIGIGSDLEVGDFNQPPELRFEHCDCDDNRDCFVTKIDRSGGATFHITIGQGD
jgi:hypothetical protein